MATGADIWETVDTLLARSRSLMRYPALSEPELIEESIRYANTAQFGSALALIAGARIGALPALDPDLKPLFGKLDARSPEPWSSFRAGLWIIINRKATPEYLERLTQAASRMVLLSASTLDGGHLKVTYRYVADLGTVLSHILLLFMDQSRPHGSDLCQCVFPVCNRFFLSSKSRQETGKPPRKYCSREHMLAAHAATASERVRTSRRNRKQQARKAK